MGELAPVIVDFSLGLTPHLERDRFVEFEVRTAVQRRECLSVDLEFHDHDRSGLLAVDLLPGLGITADLADLRVLENEQ